MTILLPVLCGSQSLPSILSKIEDAVAAKNFPIELDCRDVVLVTSAFYALVAGALKRAGDRRSDVQLINVRPQAMHFIQQCKFDKVIKIKEIE